VSRRACVHATTPLRRRRPERRPLADARSAGRAADTADVTAPAAQARQQRAHTGDGVTGKRQSEGPPRGRPFAMVRCARPD
jgi:hypothetical protein